MGLQFAAAYRVRSWHRIEKKHAHYDRNANCYSTTTFRNTGVFNSGTFAMNHCIAATDMECQCLTWLLISSSLYHHWIRSLIGIAMFTHSSSMGLQFAAAYRVRSWHRIEKKHAHYDRNANCYSTTTFRNTGVFNSGTFAMNHCIAATDMECQCLTWLLISSSLYHPCPLYGRYRQIYELKSHYASSWDSVYCTYLKTSGDASMVS